MLRVGVGSAVIVGGVLSLVQGGRALARPPLVGELSSQLSLPYQPPCRLCHVRGTDAGPVDTPFGVSMRVHGLSASADSVAPALDGLRQENVDSDGDGVGDIDELLVNGDPNTRLPLPLVGDASSDGCALAGQPPDLAGAMGLLIAALAICARSRPGDPRRPP